MSMDQKMSQCIFFQLPQNCQNDVAGHLHQYFLFSNDPELYNKKKFTVVRHPCRLTTLPSNTRVSLSWDLTLIPISLGRHIEETRAFLMSARSLEMLRDTSEVIGSITMFGSEIISKRKKSERLCCYPDPFSPRVHDEKSSTLMKSLKGTNYLSS